MDVVSVSTALHLNIVDLIRTATRSFHPSPSAPAYITLLWDEVCLLEKTVGNTTKLLQFHRHPFEVFTDEPNATLSNVSRTLQRLSETVGELNQLAAHWCSLATLNRAQRCQELADQLKRHRLDLDGALISSNMSEVLFTARILSIYTDVSYRQYSQRVFLLMQDPAALRVFMDADAATDGTAELVYLADATANQTFQMSQPSASSDNQLNKDFSRETLLEYPPGGSRGSSCPVSFEGRVEGGRQRCRCKCHIGAVCSWPRKLHHRLELLFGFSDHLPTFVRRCSKPSCRAARLERGELTYIITSKLLKKFIFLSISKTSRDQKLRMCFRVERLVPEGFDSVRCAATGDLERLKTLIAAGLATPRDTTLDGWSLLHVCP